MTDIHVSLDQAKHDSRSLPISECFVSIQGEGSLTGVPSFFIRVSGCNLRCVWCDTPYASWSPDGSPRTVASIADEARAAGVAHVVVTGGEPMIFAAIEPLCAQLRAHGLHITIETAGTVERQVACDLMSISPKLANSTPTDDPRDPDGVWAKRHEQRRLDVRALQGLIDRYTTRQLKFVVSDRGDLDEIEALLGTLTAWQPCEVMLMPEGVAAPDPAWAQWVASACVGRGWRYCHRLHIELFGNTRGT